MRPESIELRNYYERPFLQNEDGYVYINPVFCNYGFYASLLRIFERVGANGNVMGKVIEGAVDDILMTGGVKFLTNKKYKLTHTHRTELGISSTERECDYIIETENSIFFLELKRKTLTSGARSGDALRVLMDLSKSLLHALAQSGCHEYVLLRDDQITFTDGTILELKNRKVECVATSLFGFFGLQDPAFLSTILMSLVNAQFNCENPQEERELNKYLNEIQNQLRTQVKRRACGQSHNLFYRSHFFSVPQLIEILEHSNDNEGFERELFRTRGITTASKDWFLDYYYHRKIVQS